MSRSPDASSQGLGYRALLGGALELAREHPVTLLGPLALLGAVGAVGTPGGLMDAPEATVPELGVAVLGAGAVAIVLALVHVLVMLSTTSAALAPLDGRATPGAMAAISSARPMFVRGLVTSLLVGLLVALGLILLVVPGIYVAVALAPWAAVVVAEASGGRRAVARSWRLTRGHRGALFLAALIVGVAAAAAAFAVGLLPVVGGVLAGAVNGVTTAALVLLGTVFYHRRAAGEPAGPAAGTPGAVEGGAARVADKAAFGSPVDADRLAEDL